MPLLEEIIGTTFRVAFAFLLVIFAWKSLQMFIIGTDSYQQKQRTRLLQRVNPDMSKHRPVVVGFFHPYAHAGGGGERVLWTIIEGVQKKYPHIVCVIYTGDDEGDKSECLSKVQSKFGIRISPDTVTFIRLRLLSYATYKYPYLTLLLQSLGSILLAAEALYRCFPDIFFDTLGFGFTYPFVYYLSPSMPIVSYTHYPTISSDMVERLKHRQESFNNSPAVARNRALTTAKICYYWVLKWLYSWAGWHASMVMTNSTWTQNHIESLFGKSSLISVLYPPCDTEALSSFPFQPRKPLIVSLAQFRPEKNHRLQIEAFSRLLERNPEYRMPPASDPVSTVATPGDLGDPEYPQLVIIGGARDSEDKARAAELRRLARDLKLDRQVHVIVNAPYSAIKQWLAVALVGIHTMVDEHFGISIVEFLSAGLVTIANSSAGPLMDIVIPANRVSPETGLCVKQQDAVGFLASDAGEYATALEYILKAPEDELADIQERARQRVSTKFSTQAFLNTFYRRFTAVLVWFDNQQHPDY